MNGFMRVRRGPAVVVLAALVSGNMLLPAYSSAVPQADGITAGLHATDTGSNITDADRDKIVEDHNKARKEVGVPALSWDNKLANEAQQWADDPGSTAGNTAHHAKNNNHHGENLFWGGLPGDATEFWAAEKKIYLTDNNHDIQSNPDWVKWGHYTQLVWTSTKRVGCGGKPDFPSAGGWLVVCRYDPPGNIQGQEPYPVAGTSSQDTASRVVSSQAIATSTTLTTSPASSLAHGTPVALTATVTPAAVGTVQFKNGTNNLSSPVTVSNGTAFMTTSTLPVGPHQLTAVFTPDNPAAFKPSTSPPASLTVTAPKEGGTAQLITPELPQTGKSHDQPSPSDGTQPDDSQPDSAHR